MEHLPIVAGVAVAILFWALTFRLFFRESGDFFEAVRLWLTPDLISAFRGEWGDDMWSSAKLGIWVGAGALGGVLVFHSFG